MKHLRKQTGMSLLELMLVFAIAAMIAIAAFNQYRNYSYRKNVRLTEESVEYVMQGLNNYWLQTCLRSKFVEYQMLTLDDLSDAGSLPVSKAKIVNPVGQGFPVKKGSNSDSDQDDSSASTPSQLGAGTDDTDDVETEPGPPFYGIIAMEKPDTSEQRPGAIHYKTHLVVVGYFPQITDDNRDYMRGLLGAQTAYGNLLFWMSVPGTDMPHLNTDLWPLNASQRYFDNKQYNYVFDQLVNQAVKAQTDGQSSDIVGECMRIQLPQHPELDYLSETLGQGGS